MRTTFEHLENVLEIKTPYIMQENEDFSAWMIQRWISMYSPELTYFCNEMFNSHYSAFLDKQMWHDGMLSILPKVKFKRVKYFKKDKKKPSDDVLHLATRLEISHREAKEFLELDKEFGKKEKTVEVFKKSS
jgi:hypothetical protein